MNETQLLISKEKDTYLIYFYISAAAKWNILSFKLLDKFKHRFCRDAG